MGSIIFSAAMFAITVKQREAWRSFLLHPAKNLLFLLYRFCGVMANFRAAGITCADLDLEE